VGREEEEEVEVISREPVVEEMKVSGSSRKK